MQDECTCISRGSFHAWYDHSRMLHGKTLQHFGSRSWDRFVCSDANLGWTAAGLCRSCRRATTSIISMWLKKTKSKYRWLSLPDEMKMPVWFSLLGGGDTTFCGWVLSILRLYSCGYATVCDLLSEFSHGKTISVSNNATSNVFYFSIILCCE